MLAMQANYPLPDGETSNSRYVPSFASQDRCVMRPSPPQQPVDASFQQRASTPGPNNFAASTALNEVLQRSLMTSFPGSSTSDMSDSIPRPHSNGKVFELNALRMSAKPEKKNSLERKDMDNMGSFATKLHGYDFPFNVAAPHSHIPREWAQHMSPNQQQHEHQSSGHDNPANKFGSFSPSVMLPYGNTGASKDLDYLLAANAARALVNQLGGAPPGMMDDCRRSLLGGDFDDREKSPNSSAMSRHSVNFRDQQSQLIEQHYAHRQQLTGRGSSGQPTPIDHSPRHSLNGLPSLMNAPPNMSSFSNSLPFSMPPNAAHFVNRPSHLPQSAFGLEHSAFGGDSQRMKDYPPPPSLESRYTPGIPRIRSTSPMGGDHQMMGKAEMSDASPNSSVSGKFVSPQGQPGNIVLYPWMNPKSCGKSHSAYFFVYTHPRDRLLVG